MKHYEIKELDFSAYTPTTLEVVGGSRPRLTLEKGRTKQKHFLKSFTHNSREIFSEFLASKLGQLVGLKIQKVWIKVFPKKLEALFRSKYPNIIHKRWKPIGALVRNIFPKGFSIRYGSQIVGKPDKRLKLSEISSALKLRYYAHQDLLACFVDMIVFDAWIGNMDRHHENWGIVEHDVIRFGQKVIVPKILIDKRYFTQLYDHGSSLLFELDEGKIERYLKNQKDFIDNYICTGSYTFLLDEDGNTDNIFNLIEFYIKDPKWKPLFKKAIERIVKVDRLNVAKVILQMPNHDLIDYNENRRKLLYNSLLIRLDILEDILIQE